MQPFADWRNAANAALHARPRLDVIGTLGTMAPAPPVCGCAPGCERRSGNAGRRRGNLDPPFRARIQARPLSSHGSLTIGDCACRGVFRPKLFGASFPSDARRHAWTVPVGATLAPVRAPDAVKSCARSAENKLTSCHTTVRLPKSCAWVPTLIRLRLRQRAAVETSQNLGVVMTTLEMLFQNGHECLRSTQGTRRNFFEALPWSAPIDRLPNN